MLYITCLLLKLEFKVIKRKKETYFNYIFYWFGRTRSFAYVPVRDQNLVVRDRNWRLIGCVFFISFEKGFKMKSQVANKNWFVFFMLKEEWLKVELKLIWNLIKKEIKRTITWFWIKVYYENDILWFLVICMFLLFFEY